KVPTRILHRLPENVTLREAALTEPFCVAYSSLVKHSNIKPGDLVVIIGPGAIGILSAKVASIMGAGDIVVIGTPEDKKRLEVAKEFGATEVFTEFNEDVKRYVQDIRDGYGADIVVDSAGVSETFRMAMDLVRPAGQINKIGWGPTPLGFSLDPLISKAVTVNFTFSHNWDVWEKCLILMNKKMIELEKLVTHELTIDHWEEGFKLVESREGLKVLLKPID
ncbi:MAG TPA: zinc-binding dehydrogenase, partial [bacterium]|nr:zinc-binding dehydrogenase [bacterium]